MASAGLKRPSDFDLEYPSPHTSPNSSSATDPCQWSANKRRCTAFANQSMMAMPPQLANAYANNLQQQMNLANLQQQHQQNNQAHNQYHHSPTSSTAHLSSLVPPSHVASSGFKDPSLVLGTICDDVSSLIKNEVHHAHQNQQPHNQAEVPNQQQNQNQHNQQHQHQQQGQQQSQAQQQIGLPENYDAPILSMRQTQAICEKIIRERELRLREEYDKILLTKLAEQYDTFVKYTYDHIEKRYDNTNSHHASYLS